MTFIGTWAYRSLLNNPDLALPFDQLQFGKGTLVLTEPETGKIDGTLGGPGWSLDLDGTAIPGEPATINFTGKAMIGGEPWQYSYLGYVVPNWLNGVDQADTIVGSIIRDIPHSNGAATAGFVASWYAVRQ